MECSRGHNVPGARDVWRDWGCKDDGIGWFLLIQLDVHNSNVIRVDAPKDFNSTNPFESSEPAEVSHSSLVRASLRGDSEDTSPSQGNK